MIYFYIGTTAEFIKISPILRELKKSEMLFKIITSGQGKILFDEFEGYIGGIEVDYAFPFKGEKSVLSFIVWTIRTFFMNLIYFRNIFKDTNRPQDFFIVHGDTVSSLLGALVARIFKIKLVHIESGLRSFNFFEPFPEEICRYIISNIADIHFCPNLWGISNLINIQGVKINTYQNTLIETCAYAARAKVKPLILNLKKNKYYVLVLHRQEHVIFGKKKGMEAIEFILNQSINMPCVLIMHSLTKNFLTSMGKNEKWFEESNIIPMPRLPYIPFTKLINGAQFLITDGGSNQEEAYYLGKPCLILRNNTERIEGLRENAILSGFDKGKISKFISNYQSYKRHVVTSKISPSKIIVDYLKTWIKN